MSQFREILGFKLSFIISCQQERKWTVSPVMVEHVVSKWFQSTERFCGRSRNQTERTKRLQKELGDKFPAQESENKSQFETKRQEELPAQGSDDESDHI